MNFIRFNAPSHPELMQFQEAINAEAIIAGVPPCALAAIVWRETGGQNILQIGVTPGPGCGVGLTQITAGVDWSNITAPTLHGYNLMNPADNLYVAAAYYLAPAIAAAARLRRDNRNEFNRFGDGQQLYYAFAAYNAGSGAVQRALANGEDPNTKTTDSYASDTYAKYLALVQES